MSANLQTLRTSTVDSNSRHSHSDRPDAISMQERTRFIWPRRKDRILFIFIPTIVYSFLALLVWTLICILSFHPLTKPSYGFTAAKPLNSPSESFDISTRSEQWYRAARVLGSIVNVATIPVISTVCASVCIVHSQNKRDVGRVQSAYLVNLADNGWANPVAYAKILLGALRSKPTGFILYLLVSVYVIGSVTWPIQSLFLSSKMVKTPTLTTLFGNIVDIPTLFNPLQSESLTSTTMDFVVMATRRNLQTANNMQTQNNLWQRQPNLQRPSFDIIDDMDDPFYAQLPTSFNTGIIRQFAPRINSSAQYESIDSDTFPSQCETMPGAFYVHYSLSGYEHLLNPAPGYAYQVNLAVCMPRNLTNSPWLITRDRQDFTEELYLNISIVDGSHLQFPHRYFRVTLSTTAGYFELPNYMNNNLPGPLLSQDPLNMCEDDCINQTAYRVSPLYVREDMTSSDGSSVLAEALFESAANNQYKGPLFTIAVALFGPGSFIDTWIDMETISNSSWIKGHVDSGKAGELCADLAPMVSLLIPSSFTGTQPFLKGCVEPLGFPGWETLDAWLTDLAYVDAGQVSKAFTAAAFIANQAWFDSTYPTWLMAYDMGQDTEVPAISHAGIIVVSILLGLYIPPLLLLAFYAAVTPMGKSNK